MNAPLLHLHRARRRQAQPRPPARPRLGDILLRDGALAQDQITRALTDQSRHSARLGDIIAGNGVLSRAAVNRALARMHRVKLVDLNRDPADPRLATLISPRDCLEHRVLPWRREGAALILACASPNKAADFLRRLPRSLKPVRLVMVEESQLDRAIAEAFPAALAARAETRTPLAQSCRGWSLKGGLIWAALLGATLAITPATALINTLFWLACLTLILNSGLKLACLLAQLRKPAPVPQFQHRSPQNGGKLPKITVLVPLYKEERIASALIERLKALDYPPALLEIFMITEADDWVTRRALARAKLPHGMRALTAPVGTLKTKPRAMNFALDFAAGEIVGIYDAEDAPARDQLYRVARRFQGADERLACVQGILSFYNPKSSWLARCFSFEYAGWFRVMLPGLERLGFAIPLGGTTLFFRRDALISMGGWDAHNVTEDADLGIRLARHGYRCEMLETVTEEEATTRTWPWVRQRSRWLKGYAITWITHSRTPLRLWRELGAWKFAGFQLLFLGTILSFALAPLLWWSVAHFLAPSVLPAPARLGSEALTHLALLFACCEALTLTLFIIAHRKLTRRPALAWVITLPAYFTLATLAAYKGIAELFWKPYFWDKTDHGHSLVEPNSGVSARVNLKPRFKSNRQMVT